MCVCVLPACISVPLVCREARVGLRAPRAGSKIVVSPAHTSVPGTDASICHPIFPV